MLADSVYWESFNRTYTCQNEPSPQDEKEFGGCASIGGFIFMPKSINMEVAANIC